jgi:hypothetical protein
MKKSNNPKLLFETTIIKILNKNKIIDTVSINQIVKEPLIKNVQKQQKENIELKQNINYEFLEKLENIRINNTLCNFNKKQLLEMKSKIDDIRVMLMNPQYSEIVSLILEGTLKAVGNNNIIFVYDSDRLSILFNEQIIKIQQLFKEVYNEQYKLIATNINKWNQIKDEFNNKKKKYEYIEEPNLENIEKKLGNDIDQEFSDIIEYS